MPRIRINVEHAGCPIEQCHCPEVRAAATHPSLVARRALAVDVFARAFRTEAFGAWAQASDDERRTFAKRVLAARLHWNRAGVLRHRVIRWGTSTT